MSTIKKAVLLVAGLGSRLKPLTELEPKCLTEINGKPFLVNALEVLSKNGIEEVVIVIGYMGDKIIKKIGYNFNGVKITYIWNKIYSKTNSMYSAWLARKYLEQGALLIEGDYIFENEIIKQLLKTDDKKSYWVGDNFTREDTGSMLIVDKNCRIIEGRIVREKLKEYKKNYFKSVGIVKLTKDYGKAFSEWLSQDVEKGNVNIYYDNVIGKHVKEKPLYVFNIHGLRWYEVDDLNDLKKAEKIFSTTKHIIIIMDGAADFPIKELGNKTPLEKANLTYINKITKEGRTGLMQTSYLDFPIGSAVAILGILGYNPVRYYPNGRASFEAIAQGISLKEKDIAFRCNFITVKNGKIADSTAGMIDDELANEMIKKIKIKDKNIELYHGQNYRNLLILRDAPIEAKDLVVYEPHMNIGKEIKKMKIKGKTKEAEKIAKKLNKFMIDSIKELKEINKNLKTKADMLWLWSPSSKPNLPPFYSKFNISGAVVSGVDVIRGIAKCVKMEQKKIDGATGDINTNLKAKMDHAFKMIDENDFVLIHINAPDEESHMGNVKNKVKAIEKIDKEVVGPLLKYLKKNYKNNYRIAILPDHYTLLSNGSHNKKPVPYMVYGKGISKDNVKVFSEKEIEKNSKILLNSYEFLNFFVGKD